MASVLANGQIKNNDGSIVSGQNGGWYDGQQLWNGSLGAAGVGNNPNQSDIYGKSVPNATVAQTNPSNVAYIQNLKASDLQPPIALGLPSTTTSPLMNTSGIQQTADAARNTLDTTLATQKATVDQQLLDAKTKQQDVLTNDVQPLTTPFRQNLEETQREALSVNANFQANQALIDELDSLLTQGNDLIKQQESVTGLSAIRNPRVQKTMSDIQARAGVIQAVMSARNSQISTAFTMIDRTSSAITQDRNDQLSYYQTVLDLNSKDILSLDSQSQGLAKQQIQLLQDDNTRAQATVDYVKQLMINPDTASLMGQAGVTLNDSVDQINGKLQMAQYANEVKDMANQAAQNGYSIVVDPSKVPANQLVTLTDSQGKKYYYQKTVSSTAGGGTTASYKAEFSKDAAKGYTLGQMFALYAGLLDPNDIYTLYNATSSNGPDTNSKAKKGTGYLVGNGVTLFK